MVKPLLGHLATLFGADDDPHLGDDSHARGREEEWDDEWDHMDDADEE
ncbi:hypothetical protein ACFHYQ_28980 [Sphaerimonospora cavernae]|uniref:Uncharacterized protein n=1 Tax=Sphaerimonospora cavernae TaxID=1740611 RepID=A0ABV6UDQ3_9ACTN